MAYTEEEMAQYQRLSNDYVPEAEVDRYLLATYLTALLIMSIGTSCQSTTTMP